MTKRQPHLSDDTLLELCLEGGPNADDRRHLEACPTCEERRAALAHLLADCAEAATADADAAFPVDRLARQQARILQRLEQDGRPARIISFPAAHGPEPALRRSRPGMRWLAGAAAAGLVIGILAGHLAHDVSLTGVQTVAQPAGPSAPGARQPAATAAGAPGGEEEFLGRLERAVQRSSGSALSPLDDLTPLVWEVSAN